MQNISYGSLFLSGSTSGFIIAIIALAILTVVAVIFAAIFIRKWRKIKNERNEEAKTIGTAKEQAQKIIDEANAQSKVIKKEAILESKEQELARRTEFSKRKTLSTERTKNFLLCRKVLRKKKSR